MPDQWTNTLHSQIIKVIESTFEGALQASCFHSINGVKSPLLGVMNPVLSEAVRCRRADTVSGSKMRSLGLTKTVTDTIV